MTKQRLGRGLGAFFATGEEEIPSEIAVADIVPNRFQPRRVFDEEALGELAQSIKLHGVIQPVLVRKTTGGFELVAGERRWRAAQMLGLKAIPAVVRDYTDSEMTEISLIENLQRENLNPIEEAQAFRRLMEEFGFTQEEMARRIGRSRSLIANTVRLLNLAPAVQEHVSRGTLSTGHVRPLLALADPALQQEAADSIIEEELSARDAEELVRRLVKVPQMKKAAKKPAKEELFLSEAEERLKMILGTQVKIKAGKMKSKIEIEFYTAEDLERIIEVLTAQQYAAATRPRGPLVV